MTTAQDFSVTLEKCICGKGKPIVSDLVRPGEFKVRCQSCRRETSYLKIRHKAVE